MSKILIIEDNYEIRENLAEMLNWFHYDTQACENGIDGLEQALRWKPDVIICDVLMHGMDGYSVLQSLRCNPSSAGIPFIFLTSKSEASDMLKGKQLGANQWIKKPFTEEELTVTIQSCLGSVRE